MAKLSVLVFLGMLFVFSPFGANADGTFYRGCPNGTLALFVDTSLPGVKETKGVLAAVVIRGNNLQKFPYLHTRSDGWTNLSSEKNRFLPGGRVANCLPPGIYSVRIEYYSRVNLIGDWLFAVFENEVFLNQSSLVVELSPDSRYLSPTPWEHFKRHWHLFLVYSLLPAIFVLTVFVTKKQLRRG